ncbi:MAG: hypothetical protein ACFCVK_25455 [Acidimicrobiales bacterium]
MASPTGTVAAQPMAYNEAMRWPGYGPAFALLDRIVVALSDRSLSVVDDAADDGRWGWLTEDQLVVEHPEGRIIDVGWYPDNHPTGSWRVSLVDGTETTARSEQRSVAGVVQEVERLAGLDPR